MLVGRTYLVLALGDIAQELADVIVVAGAPHGSCPTGEAVISNAGSLPARYLVHAVGPAWQGGTMGEAGLLRRAYLNSLSLAAEYGAATIAIAPISTGSYPIEKAAPAALGAARDFAMGNQQFREIRFVLANERDLSVYRQALGALPLDLPAAPAGRGTRVCPTTG
ncbi:MAG TPA: macro domain-containing protein [Symbiobacteriaceae bacterium]|nr:macro domain-containing protein [Symbiobacteriaceae bacterium]